MGLLDALIGGGDNGGLLSLIRKSALNQDLQQGLSSDQAQYGQPQVAQQPQYAAATQNNPQPSAMDNAQWPVGPVGAPSQANAQMPQQAQAQPQQMPQQAPQAPQQDFGSNLMAGYQNMKHGGGLIGSIAAAVTGQRNDDQGIALQQQAQTQNMTKQWLMQRGATPEAANAAIANPEVLKSLVEQMKPANYVSAGNGYALDPKSGKFIKGYEPEQKDNFVVVQTGEDGLGRKTFAKMNKATGEQTPIGDTSASSAGGLGDMNKSGAEYLNTLPKQVKGTVQGMLDGTIQPPSSFAAAKPYWQGMVAAAKNADPSFDENKWASRHKMSTDMAASGNSSIGGILSNGKSSFKHLAEYTESAADLGNASHNFPLGGVLAHAQNYVGNSLSGSDTNAKIKAINDNLGHYGQESTKFYAGTGGGVEERMNALKEMNPTTTSSAEMAAYAEKEKSLMLDRLREKEAQIRDTMGDAYLKQHPVFTPELQKDIERIDGNVKRLRGDKAESAGVDRSAIEAEMKRRGLLK